MIERFQDRRRLLEALLEQRLVHGNPGIAESLCDVVELLQYEPGQPLIAQGAVDDHLLLVLAGGVEILINGRPIAKRGAREHIGEMALLRPDGRRSATVVATETTVVARIEESAFSAIANREPVLWRRVASILADRLKQRSQFIRARNETPIMFVGSSKEGLEVAQAIQSGLARDPVIVRLWTDGVFGPSTFTIEDLEREVGEADFGVLVLTPDDQILSRGEQQDAPRDNVIFELGMLLGGIGRPRSYFVMPRGKTVRIPSDLFGMNPLTYVPANGRDLAARLGPACSALRAKVLELGPR